MIKKKVEILEANGTIAGCMLPKTGSCFEARDAGCAKVRIIDGRALRVLLLEIFTKENVCTEITTNL